MYNVLITGYMAGSGIRVSATRVMFAGTVPTTSAVFVECVQRAVTEMDPLFHDARALRAANDTRRLEQLWRALVCPRV